MSPLLAAAGATSTAATLLTFGLVFRDCARVHPAEGERPGTRTGQTTIGPEAPGSGCADREDEVAALRERYGTESVARARADLAFRLLCRTAPVVGGLAGVAVRKSEQSSAALTDEVFALGEDTEALSTTIADSLSTMSSGEDSLESAMSDLNLDVERLKDVRGAQSEAETSVKRYLAMVGEEVAQASRLLETIEDIAEQTNVLAINAAIQAAKAGQYGRGFSVIAGEIQKLSVATGRASQTIAENTRRVATHFADFSRAHETFISDSVAKLSSAVESIERTIDKLEPRAGKIARSVHEAARTSREANERLARITEDMQTHDAIEQIVSHMHTIVEDIVGEAESIAESENLEPEAYDIGAALVTIAGRHMTMQDEFAAIGNDHYDHSGAGRAMLADGTKLKGDVTLF
ncbi:MAG: methyl-accepting chemotaxis protein [Spirochaetota bacterium]